MSTAPLQIRRAQPRDAAAFVRIMGEPSVQRNLLQMPYPDEDRWRVQLTEMNAPGKSDIVLVAERADDDGVLQVLGNAGLHPGGNSIRRRHAMGLGIVIAANAQGQGVGSALMQALCDYADDWAQVLRLELSVFTDNARAIALYKRFGFEVEGTLRGYGLRDGVYTDVLTMARWHPNPPRRAGEPVA